MPGESATSVVKRRERWLRTLPAPLKTALKAAANPPDRLRVAVWRRRHGYAPPIPDLLLRTRVGSGTSIAGFVESGRAQGAREVAVAHDLRDPPAPDDKDGGDGPGARYPPGIRVAPLRPLFHDHGASPMEDAPRFEADVRAAHPLPEQPRAASGAAGTAQLDLRVRELYEALRVAGVQGLVPRLDDADLRDAHRASSSPCPSA